MTPSLQKQVKSKLSKLVKLNCEHVNTVLLLPTNLIKPYKMPLRHQRTKYKTQQAYKTSELMEQKNLAKPNQRQLILDNLHVIKLNQVFVFTPTLC